MLIISALNRNREKMAKLAKQRLDCEISGPGESVIGLKPPCEAAIESYNDR